MTNGLGVHATALAMVDAVHHHAVPVRVEEGEGEGVVAADVVVRAVAHEADSLEGGRGRCLSLGSAATPDLALERGLPAVERENEAEAEDEAGAKDPVRRRQAALPGTT